MLFPCEVRAAYKMTVSISPNPGSMTLHRQLNQLETDSRGIFTPWEWAQPNSRFISHREDVQERKQPYFPACLESSWLQPLASHSHLSRQARDYTVDSSERWPSIPDYLLQRDHSPAYGPPSSSCQFLCDLQDSQKTVKELPPFQNFTSPLYSLIASFWPLGAWTPWIRAFSICLFFPVSLAL